MSDALVAELSVKAARLEMERDEARAQLATAQKSLAAWVTQDKDGLLDTLHIIGIPARELSDIYDVVYEWRRRGWPNSSLDLFKRVLELEHENDELLRAATRPPLPEPDSERTFP